MYIQGVVYSGVEHPRCCTLKALYISGSSDGANSYGVEDLKNTVNSGHFVLPAMTTDSACTPLGSTLDQDNILWFIVYAYLIVALMFTCLKYYQNQVLLIVPALHSIFTAEWSW